LTPHRSFVPVLFQAVDDQRVFDDPINEAWLAIVRAVAGPDFELLERRYYLALYHFRKQQDRPPLPNQVAIEADDREQAKSKALQLFLEQKDLPETAADIFVDPRPAKVADLPPALADPTVPPPLLEDLRSGPGRPPADALCLMRAFLAAPLLVGRDDPTSVHRLLRSNPIFARACDFLGPKATKATGEWTSRRLPSLAACEQFEEVMTRYGLWQLARLDQVQANIESGVVEVEDTLAFDTSHMEAHSGCATAELPPKDGNDGKSEQRKIPRITKHCSCGKERWDTCEHPWDVTDPGAAVVVKGPTRIYWAHKASFAGFARSEVPIDARVLRYAATHDGKTLAPHLEVLVSDLPEAVSQISHALADTAYRGKQEQVDVVINGVTVHVPIHPRKPPAALADRYAGVERFTTTGVPVCVVGHRFEMLGRDLDCERYIWVAPQDADGKSVCTACHRRAECLLRGGAKRRHLRVHRADFPQIDWEHPQHLSRNRRRYGQRTGVERGIKRLKVDLCGEVLTHRNAVRVQAHLDRRLLALHLLLAAAHQDTS